MGCLNRAGQTALTVFQEMGERLAVKEKGSLGFFRLTVPTGAYRVYAGKESAGYSCRHQIQFSGTILLSILALMLMKTGVSKC